MKIASVILAAGLGKRMHSTLPKTLHPLLGKPIVFHALDAVLPQADLPPVLVTGYGSELVREEIARAYGERVSFALQLEQLGTGHAVRSAEDQLRGKADLLLVTFGDMPMLRPETIQRLIKIHHDTGSTVTMTSVIGDLSRGFGRVVRSTDGKVQAIVEEAVATPEQLKIREYNISAYCFDAEWIWQNLAELKPSPKGEFYITDLVETFPTMEDYIAEVMAVYENDIKEAFPKESANEIDVFKDAQAAFIGEWGPKDESMGGEGVANISGIKKIDEYTVEVTTKGYEAPAVYSILGISITPMHYYGDPEKYDYENNMFGFEFGDLSKQESLTATPMGAGPYKFIKYDNRVVYFEANPYYYRGCPKISEIQFRETASNEVVTAIETGAADAGEMSYNKTRYEEVMTYNGNGEMTGPVITSSLVDNLGYGYIGINASTVNVAGAPGSDASKNLRRALATVLAVYRDVAIDSYYGEAAAVINYPISNTSWAAPQPTDEGYKVAFSTDVNGEPIYTAEMTQEEKYVAAEQAALGFFEAAGFTVEDGKVTAAPEGAKLSYELIVPGDGIGDHPAFAIITGARDSLAKIGMELVINDPADANILWQSLDSGQQELWTAAWGSSIDPDMYQIYHSSNIVGLEGSTEDNHYHITDEELDQLIIDARKSDDQNFRKAVYKEALEKVIEWAVEIPTYQRKNVVIFSTERINIDTLTPDITTFWGWMNDLELVEMN